jgi:hypothetical protein
MEDDEETIVATPGSSRFEIEDDEDEKTRVGLYEEDHSFEMDSFGNSHLTRNENMGDYNGNDFIEVEEKRVLRKLDKRVVLFVALLYLLSFLDRSNIGNARIAGLERDLNLSSAQYEWLLTAFYITYILFEWMALLYVLILVQYQD